MGMDWIGDFDCSERDTAKKSGAVLINEHILLVCNCLRDTNKSDHKKINKMNDEG